MRRHNYTTPKSYLEFNALYKALLAQKRTELKADKERLENGVDKIAQASAQVSMALFLNSSPWSISLSNAHTQTAGCL